MARRHSRSEAEIEARLEQLDPNSQRYQVLNAARQFKASWVALGESLTAAREKSSYRAWGYPSFEAYCRRELQIKQETANKLTRSFAFLRDHEPDVLSERDSRELPPLDVVDLLSQARERTKMSDDEFATIRDEALSPESKSTRHEVMKRLREVDPEAFKPAPKPTLAPGENDLRKALLLAERLETLLQAQGEQISQATVQNAHCVVEELRERFAESRRQGAA